MDEWWVLTSGPDLAQGDLLSDCLLPVFLDEPIPSEAGEYSEIEVARQRLIIVTQSCDLENPSIEFVALCPIYTLPEFEQANSQFTSKGRWENVRKGREPGLHLIASPNDPNDNRGALVVEFGHIVSLPFAYLQQHAAALGDHHRLLSPYLEHFSQAFARFFMRVGLPSSIPPYK
jgi:hypothetical protein